MKKIDLKKQLENKMILEINKLDSMITEVGLICYYTYPDGTRELRTQIPCFCSEDYNKTYNEKLNFIAQEIVRRNFKLWGSV